MLTHDMHPTLMIIVHPIHVLVVFTYYSMCDNISHRYTIVIIYTYTHENTLQTCDNIGVLTHADTFHSCDLTEKDVSGFKLNDVFNVWECHSTTLLAYGESQVGLNFKFKFNLKLSLYRFLECSASFVSPSWKIIQAVSSGISWTIWNAYFGNFIRWAWSTNVYFNLNLNFSTWMYLSLLRRRRVISIEFNLNLNVFNLNGIARLLNSPVHIFFSSQLNLNLILNPTWTSPTWCLNC